MYAREEEFPSVEIHPTPAGRQAFVAGTGLVVWEVALLARALGGDAQRVAAHLAWPPEQVEAALAYAAAHPDEIGPPVEEVESVTYEELKGTLPGLRQESSDSSPRSPT